MPTDLKNFEGGLNNLESSRLDDVLTACKNKFQANLTPDKECMKKTGYNEFVYYNSDGIMNSPLPYTGFRNGAVDTMYTYNVIETKYYSDANNWTIKSDFLNDLTDISRNIYSIDSSFNNYHTNNINLYTQMKSSRNDLDNKMRSLYEDGYTDNQIFNENAVLINLSWTIAATCVLYFLFVKL